MGKYEKHLGLNEPITINGEEFYFKPLGIDYSKHMMIIGKAFSNAKPKEGESEEQIAGKFMEKLTPEVLDIMTEVVYETVKRASPDEPEDEVKMFAGKYFMQLLMPIIKLNNGGLESVKSKEDTKHEAIERLRKERAARLATEQTTATIPKQQ